MWEAAKTVPLDASTCSPVSGQCQGESSHVYSPPDWLVRIRPRNSTVYTSQGRTVMATSPDGFIFRHKEHGLWFYQSRVLSRYRWLINGEPPLMSANSNIQQHAWMGYYIASPPADETAMVFASTHRLNSVTISSRRSLRNAIAELEAPVADLNAIVNLLARALTRSVDRPAIAALVFGQAQRIADGDPKTRRMGSAELEIVVHQVNVCLRTNEDGPPQIEAHSSAEVPHKMIAAGIVGAAEIVTLVERLIKPAALSADARHQLRRYSFAYWWRPHGIDIVKQRAKRLKAPVKILAGSPGYFASDPKMMLDEKIAAEIEESPATDALRCVIP